MWRLFAPPLPLLLFLCRPRPSVAEGESPVFLLPQPQNLTVESYNFENVLKWSPVKGINGTVTYHVEYRLESDKPSDWKRINCRDTTKPECDFDHGKDFYRIVLRLRAEQGGLKSNWSEARRFQARKDTILGPPRAINVTSEANSLILSFLPPLDHRGDTFDFEYVIYFWEASVRTKDSRKVTNTEYKFKNLKEMTEYCFQVQAVYKENRGQRSDIHCNKTTTTETTRIVRVVLIFAFVVFAIFAAFLCLWISRKYKSAIKSFWQPPLRIPTHYEEDLENPPVDMKYFQNSAEEHWDIVSIISDTGQSQILRDSFASRNQVEVSELKEHR